MTVDVEEAKAELIGETASQVREHLPRGDDAQAERFLASTRPRFRPTTSSSATTPARTRDPLGRAPDDRGPPRDEGIARRTRLGTTPRAPSRSRSSTLRSTGRPITISSTSSKGDTERALADVRAAVDDWRPKREARWRSPSPGRGPTSAGCRLPPGPVQGLVLGVLQVRRARALSWVGVCHADS
jgi:hypothetical protein